MTNDNHISPAPVTQIVPPLWLIIIMIGMWGLHGLVPITRVFPPIWEGAGRVLILTGFSVVFYCARMFKKAGTPLRPFLPVKRVLTTGPFRYSRNPVYLGMIILLAGWAIALGSLSPWIGVSFFIALITNYWIIPEEAQMERQMGQEYLDYKAQVRRWL